MENPVEEILRRFHPDLEFTTDPEEDLENEESGTYRPAPDDDLWQYEDEYEEFRELPCLLQAA